MKVVLDTNVLLSALLTRGVCEALLDRCIADEAFRLVTSEYILSEFSRMARTKFGLAPDEIDAVTAFLRRHADLVEPRVVPKSVCPDKDDLPILGTAVAARASALVTGDMALLRVGTYERIPVVTPRALYDALR